MKIIELLDNKVDEGLGSALKTGAKLVGKGVKGTAGLANAFVSGASGGQYDIQNWSKYIKTPKGTTRSINANLPPQDQFNQVLEAIYGKSKVSSQLKKDWADAINSGKDSNVTAVGNKYGDLRREEGLDNDKLKQSHTTVIRDLLDMANGGQKFESEPKKEKPADKKDKENPDEEL